MSGLRFDANVDSCPIVALDETDLASWRESASQSTRQWIDSTKFEAKAGEYRLVPDANGYLSQVLVAVERPLRRAALAAVASALPAGTYHLTGDWSAAAHEQAALGWALASYRFDRYKSYPAHATELVVNAAVDRAKLESAVAAHFLVRDLINTPTEDMGPADLAAVVEALGREFEATVTSIVGDDLLAHGMRAIHAVGRASHRSPRLVDLSFGDPAHPKLTLVGKGVCFDTGGLNLKPASGMRLMKKDMGGAAHAIGLARMVMAGRLPVRLRLLVSAVENAVSGPAYRPGDIIRAKNGKTIEIDNTDAEGRVILSDALVTASEESPDLIIDFATLTGAARVALGTDVPAMFCNKDATADGIRAAAERTDDPLWRLPLYRPYRSLIDSPVADIVNSASGPHGGAIIAALFLQDFVEPDADWVHFDLMAWNNRSRPGRPEGGEAMGLHALFDYLSTRYG